LAARLRVAAFFRQPVCDGFFDELEVECFRKGEEGVCKGAGGSAAEGMPACFSSPLLQVGLQGEFPDGVFYFYAAVEEAVVVDFVGRFIDDYDPMLSSARKRSSLFKVLLLC
jgi:hypothetical protein